MKYVIDKLYQEMEKLRKEWEKFHDQGKKQERLYVSEKIMQIDKAIMILESAHEGRKKDIETIGDMLSEHNRPQYQLGKNQENGKR